MISGHRPDAQKLVFLITDGEQSPKVDSDTGESFDPVKASEKLIQDKVTIIAVGIGDNINVEQLKAITRNPSHVFLTDDFDKLISEDFVDQVTDEVCKGKCTYYILAGVVSLLYSIRRCRKCKCALNVDWKVQFSDKNKEIKFLDKKKHIYQG